MTVCIVITVAILVFMPFVFSGFIYLDKESKRLNVSLYLFSVIKIFGGFFEKRKKCYFLHYNNKKAKMFKSNDMGKMKFKLKDISTIEFFKSFLVFSFPETPTNYAISDGIVVLSNYFYPYMHEKKDFMILKTYVLIGYCESTKIYYRINFAINIFTVILLIIKVLLRYEK